MEARLDVILGLMPPEKGQETSTNSDGMEESQVALVGGWDVGLLFKTLHIHFSRFILPKCYTGFQADNSVTGFQVAPDRKHLFFLCVAALDIDAVGFITQHNQVVRAESLPFF